MKVRTIKEAVALSNKTVLCRVDYNLPLKISGKVNLQADERILQTVPTLKFLMRKKAKIVLLTHLGNPGGEKNPRLAVNSIAGHLGKILKKKIIKTDEIISKKNYEMIRNARPKDIIMLENLRFDAREEKNSREFAKEISQYGDIYVNDAFSASHRRHASLVAIQKFLPSYAGLSLENEVKKLHELLDSKKHPFTLIMGGSKISTKLSLIKSLLPLADFILLGGALANTFLYKMKIPVGKSLIEKKSARSLSRNIINSYKIFVPLDAVCAKKIDKKVRGVNKKIHMIGKDDIILDIGKETQKEYSMIIQKSKTIFWNGPLGYYELPQFRHGTDACANAIVQSSTNAVIGGGDVRESMKSLNLKHKHHIFFSSGGGALLEYLKNKTLPAIQPFIHNK